MNPSSTDKIDSLLIVTASQILLTFQPLWAPMLKDITRLKNNARIANAVLCPTIEKNF